MAVTSQGRFTVRNFKSALSAPDPEMQIFDTSRTPSRYGRTLTLASCELRSGYHGRRRLRRGVARERLRSRAGDLRARILRPTTCPERGVTREGLLIGRRTKDLLQRLFVFPLVLTFVLVKAGRPNLYRLYQNSFSLRRKAQHLTKRRRA